MVSASIIAVLFALVAIGYCLARFGVLKPGAGEVIGDFVVTVAIPSLLFRTLAEANFENSRPLLLWAVYFSAAAIVWLTAMLVIQRGFNRDARSAVVAGLSAGYSNLVLVGIPVILALHGRAGTEVMSVLIAVHLPIMMGVSVMLFERAEHLDGARHEVSGLVEQVNRFLVNLFKNPIVIGIVAGLLWRLSPVGLPTLFSDIVDRLAGLAGTLALIALGMSLHRFGIARNVPQSAVITIIKLLLFPALVTLFSWLFKLPPLIAQIAIVCAAMPTGMNPYLIATRFGTGEALAANTTLLSTVAAPASIIFWAWIANLCF